MVLNSKSIYSFDDCSILNLCEIPIPPSHQFLFSNRQKITTQNYEKLNSLLKALRDDEIKPYKFIPSNNLSRNLFQAAVQLMEDNSLNVNFLPDTFSKETIDHLNSFYSFIQDDFEDITKSDDFISIKLFFQNNERTLRKSRRPEYTNIPEDDDCMILAGLYEYQIGNDGEKHLISADEHFWGYDDLIKVNYGIIIVKEYQSHRII